MAANGIPNQSTALRSTSLHSGDGHFQQVFLKGTALEAAEKASFC
jgi:hypothetical protein